MKIKATATLIYDQEVMDQDGMTDTEFWTFVKNLIEEDFNGGIDFQPQELEMEKLS